MIKLWQGDCLDLMDNIEDNSVDCIICDLPYGTTACKWDVIIPFDKLWEQYKRVIKEHGAIILFGCEPFSSNLRLSNIENYKYDWIWNKVRPVGAHVVKIRPMSQTENISVFSGNNGERIEYYPIKTPCKPRRVKEYKRTEIMGGNKKVEVDHIVDSKNPTTLLTFSNADMTRRLHPTQKPVQLLEYLIRTYTKEGELVLDNCMGSGTTGVACKHLNRSFIGIEKDPVYFQIAKERIENEVVQMDIFDFGIK